VLLVEFESMIYLGETTAGPAGPGPAKISNGPFGSGPALKSRSARTLLLAERCATAVHWKDEDREVYRGQAGLDRHDRCGGVLDASITWVWQENGYGYVMLSETAISNAILLSQYGNESTPSGPLAHSCAPYRPFKPPPTEQNRLFQVRPALASMGTMVLAQVLRTVFVYARV
jgi:hypothetical protein